MNRTNQKLTGRKKRTRFYEAYLSKLLKQISPDNGVTANSKQQLNSILCSITKLIATKIRTLTEVVKKKTVSPKEVTSAIKILFSPGLSKGIIVMCNQALNNFLSDDNMPKGITRQEKAGIIFPPSVAEKYLRNFGYSKIMVSSAAPITLAAAIEYLAGEILENAVSLAKQNKHVRITVRDLEIGVCTDKDINIFFKAHNISFLGGGVVPYIHPNLLVKKARRRTKPFTSEKRPHRYRPGTVSIREIRRFQKASNCLILAKFPFEKYVRSIVKELSNSKTNLKVSKNVFVILQYFIEQQIVTILRKANMATIHAGRVKLIISDIELVRSIENGSNMVEVSPSKPLAVNIDKETAIGWRESDNSKISIAGIPRVTG